MNERVAVMLDHPKLGAGYLAESRQLYLAWGCVPKVAAFDGVTPSPLRHSQPLNPPAATDRSTITSLGDDARSQTNSSEDADHPPSQRANEGSIARPQWESSETIMPKRPAPSSHGSFSGLVDDTHSDLRSVGHSEVPSRSHLATELDLRTVVTASSVISSEIAVDG